MSTYFSLTGNPEVWKEKPTGYYTPEEWETLHPTPEPSIADLEAQYKRWVQAILDEAAYARGYTGPKETVEGACLSVCSYIDTGVEQFDAEGKAFRAWRSAVWAAGLELMNTVLTGERELPTRGELPELLPKLEEFLL